MTLTGIAGAASKRIRCNQLLSIEFGGGSNDGRSGMGRARASSHHRMQLSRPCIKLDFANMKSHDAISEAKITIRHQFLIGRETYLRNNSRTPYGSSNVVLAKKGTSRSMRFLKRFGLLLVITLTLGLFCSEVPESFSLCDDTSNDFVTSTRAHSLENIQTVRQEANPRPVGASIVAFPSVLLTCSCETPLASGSELLRLLSIQ